MRFKKRRAAFLPRVFVFMLICVFAVFVSMQGITLNTFAATPTPVPVTTFAGLQTAIEGAASGTAWDITINGDITFDNTILIKSGVTINLIDGKGTTPIKLTTSGGAFRHFQTGMTVGTVADVAGVNLTIGKGIILDGANATGAPTGGGIDFASSGGTLTLNGTIQNCKSVLHGGGIYVAGGSVDNTSVCTLNINKDAQIKNCVTGSDGSGGGIFAVNANVTMADGAVITGNKAAVKGGGVCVVSVDGGDPVTSKLTMNGGEISNSTFTDMTFASEGGGICAVDAIVNVSGGTISGNTAAGFGGGISMSSPSAAGSVSQLIITGGEISGNDCDGSKVTGGGNGGGIGVAKPIADFTIKDATITGNEATANGGGIYVVGDLTVQGSAEISDNTATVLGGGIAGYNSGTVTLDGNTMITGNTAVNGGGVGILSVGTFNLAIKGNAEISGNSAAKATSTAANNTGGNGGGIYAGPAAGNSASAKTVVITVGGTAAIADNTATVNGGGVYVAAASTLTINSAVRDAASITGNAATLGDGGGIYTEAATYLGNTKTKYANITVGAGTVFGTNTASAAYVPQAADITAATTIKTLSTSIATTPLHPLNNLDINYKSAVTFTVQLTYDANGGVGTYTVQNVVPGNQKDAATLAATGITFAGNAFQGWNTKADGTGTAYQPGDKIAFWENTTLYAQWKLNFVQVTYNANGGTGDPFTGPNVTPGNQDTVLTLAATGIARTGYTFQGWNTKADGTGTAYAAGDKITLNAVVTLYAQWKQGFVQVTYNANGGTGSFTGPDVIPGNQDTVLTLASTGITRIGYTFQGWNTKADGTGTAYAAGDKITLTAAVTLYAQWNVLTSSSSSSYSGSSSYSSSSSSGKYPDTGTTQNGGPGAMVAMLILTAVCVGGAGVFLLTRKIKDDTVESEKTNSY